MNFLKKYSNVDITMLHKYHLLWIWIKTSLVIFAIGFKGQDKTTIVKTISFLLQSVLMYSKSKKL